MSSKSFIRGLGVACLLTIAVGVLLFLLAPRLGRQAAESLRVPLDARYRQPVVVAMPEADGHVLSGVQAHGPAFPRVQWAATWTVGSRGAVEQVAAGEAGFALVRSSHPHDLDAIAWLGEERLHVVVAADSPMAAFTDLSGARVGIGAAFSDTAMLAERLLTAFQLDPPAQTLAMPFARMFDALAADELEAVLVLAPLHDPIVAERLAGGAYRLLPIVQHAALAQSLPGLRASHIPAGAYGPNRSVPSLEAGDLPTVSAGVLLAAPADAPYWQAWNLVRAVHDPEFVRAAQRRGAQTEPGAGMANLPMHRAARDYHLRAAPAPAGGVERIGFVLAAMVLFGAVAAMLQVRRRARERMDQRASILPYFESLEKLRNAIDRAREVGELRAVQNGLTQLQQQAEDEWLEGYFDSADMGNLYAALAGAADRASRRFLRMEMMQVREHLEQVRRALLAPRPEPAKPPAPAAAPRVPAPELDDEFEDVPSILLEPGREDDPKSSTP